MKVLDLFSGIGGFSLGLERAGFTTVAFCEIEPFCRAVLKKHWPHVPCYEDVRTLTAERLAADGISVDVICGGFPCQDVSLAGRRAGLGDTRSGLWAEYSRLIGELRPQYIIVENTPGLLSLGMGDVLGTLSTLGYDAVWDCVPAAAVGAPHRRDRVWVVAYADNTGPQRRNREELRQCARERAARACGSHAPNADREGQHAFALNAEMGRSSECPADAAGDRRAAQGEWAAPRYADGGRQLRREPAENWQSEPDVGRVADGVPARAHRLRALGNAVVPQIPELIGRAILKAESIA
jgi:DNA (cytosine-5)-methyltransferase 1